MMKSFLSVGFFAGLTFITPALAFDPSSPPQGRYTIQPQIPDLVPGDGIVDGGSIGNSYILEGSDGSRYEVKPQIPDVFPNDGMLDAGSIGNPWIIESAEK